MAHVAAFADHFICIQAIYIFGSVSRGEVNNAKDVDLAVEFVELQNWPAPGFVDTRLSESSSLFELHRA